MADRATWIGGGEAGGLGLCVVGGCTGRHEGQAARVVVGVGQLRQELAAAVGSYRRLDAERQQPVEATRHVLGREGDPHRHAGGHVHRPYAGQPLHDLRKPLIVFSCVYIDGITQPRERFTDFGYIHILASAIHASQHR